MPAMIDPNSHPANSASPSAHDDGHNRRPQRTGVDNPKCLEKRGGGVSETDAAPIPRYAETFCSQCGAGFGPGDHGYSHCDQHGKPRLVLAYTGADVYDARDKIQIEVFALPSDRSGLRAALRRAGWAKGAGEFWAREHDVAAIASARDILGRYYGEPV